MQASSPELPLSSNSFHVVTANFVVNHVQDPRATVRDLARVTTRGGRLAMTIWPATPGPHLAAFGAAAEDAGAVAVPSTRLPSDLDFARSAGGLAMLAGEAGLQVERAEEVAWTWRVRADDLMAGIAAGIATPGRMYQAQTPGVQRRIERSARERWAQFAGPAPGSTVNSPAVDEDWLAFPVTAVLVVARSAPVPA